MILGGSISFIVPLVIGEITNKDRYGMSWEAWMIVFGTASGIYIVSNIFYVFMISGDIQSWNYSQVSTYKVHNIKSLLFVYQS